MSEDFTANLQCPYQMIGCNDDIDTTLVDHVISDTFAHSQLLMNAINNLTNDLRTVRQTVDIQTHEIESQKLQLSLMNDERNRDKAYILVLREEINSLKTECEDMRNLIRHMDTERSLLKDDVMGLQQYDATRLCDIGELKDDFSTLNQSLTILKNDFYLTRDEIERIKDSGDIRDEIAKYSSDIEEVKTITKMCNEAVEKVQLKMRTLVLDARYDFVWTIDNFSQRKKWFQSDGFFKDNYRLCLRGWIGGLFAEYFVLYFSIMKGDRDSEVSWPMRNSVTLTIINQDTDQGQISWRCQYDIQGGNTNIFDRPVNQMNEYSGGPWMYLKDIRKIKGILVNDSMRVGCIMHPPAIG